MNILCRKPLDRNEKMERTRQLRELSTNPDIGHIRDRTVEGSEKFPKNIRSLRTACLSAASVQSVEARDAACSAAGQENSSAEFQLLSDARFHLDIRVNCGEAIASAGRCH